MKPAIHRRQGFTLIEIMVVVFVLGVLAALMVPAFTRYMHNTKATTFAKDISTLAAAGNQYAMESGLWVEDSASGTFPPELEGYFSQRKFELGSSLGGVWDFENYDLGDFTSAVGVHGPNLGDEIFAMVDQRIDDGNLRTGIFQKLASDRYYLVIED